METPKNRKTESEAAGFAIKTILIAITWTILLSGALGYSVKYGIELSQLVTTVQNIPLHKGPVRIGVFNWAGYYPLVTAKELGLFEKHGVQVELIKANTIGELNDWIRTGRTQASVGVLADFIILRSLGAPIHMMTAVDYSLTDVVLGGKSFRTPRDLIGKKVGLAELNSFAEYFVVRSLELAGVNPRTVNFYTVPVNQVPDAISKGDIDAGHTWNPALAEGLQRGFRPILSSAQNPHLVIDGLAFRIEVAQDANIPLGISRAFFEALALQKKDPVSFASIPAKYFGLTREQAQRYLDEDVRFTDLDENIRLYQPNGTLRKEATAIAQFFGERGMGAEETDLKKLIDDSVIRRIEDERAIGSVPNTQPARSTSQIDWRREP